MENMIDPRERFRNTRIPVEYRVVYTLGEMSAEGFITNISTEGIALRTRQALVIGDKLNVVSEISSNLTLEFTGEIKNVVGNIVGIEIQDIDSDIKERFLAHIDGILRLMNCKSVEMYGK